MAKVSDNKTLRSKKRARPGARTFLILVMAIILGLLLAWLLGFQLPESVLPRPDVDKEDSPFQKTSHQSPDGKKIRRQDLPTYQPENAAPLSLKPRENSDPDADESAAEDLDTSTAAAMAQGPCWLSGTLPAPLAGEKTVHMTLVSSWGETGEEKRPAQRIKLDKGRFLFRTPCQLAPVFLQVESSGRIDLFGPFPVFPYVHRDLGVLKLPTPIADSQAAIVLTWQKRELSCFAVPRARAGLLATTLLDADCRESHAEEANPLLGLDWFERATPVTVTGEAPPRFDKVLGGPWDFVAIDGRRILRTDQASGSDDSDQSITIHGLGDHDALVMLEETEKRAYLIHHRPADDIYSLPVPVTSKSRLQLFRFGDLGIDLGLTEEPGQTIDVPEAGSIIVDKEHLRTFTLVKVGAEADEAERIIKRNLLLFKLEEAEVISAPLSAGSRDSEESAASASAGTARRIRIPVNPGLYDIVQFAGTASGEKKTVGQLEVHSAADGPAPWKVPAVRTARVLIQVVDAESGTGIGGAGVRVGENLPPEAAAMSPLMHTDADGFCELPLLSGGTVDLVVTSPAHRSSRSEIKLDEPRPDEAPVKVALNKADGLTVKLSVDAAGVATVDGISLINQNGDVLSRAAEGDSVSFPSLAAGRYVAIPYLGSLSVTTDDWAWLVESSGGLVVDHHDSGGNATVEWKSPAPQEVAVMLEAKGGAGTISLQVVHAGEAPFPGVWPDQRYDSLPLGPIKLGRLLPGRYRAIATCGDQTSIADLTVASDKNRLPVLQFDFTSK